MTDTLHDGSFAGSIPELYDRHLVPVLFGDYADDLTRRVLEHRPTSLLEVAAGSGAVTRALASALDAKTEITASDLSEPMLDQARAVGTSRPVRWVQADAMALPFADGSFDLVVSQFGVMFPPDKPLVFAEMRRVLRPGGLIIFSVWDRITNNGFSNAVHDGLERYFPADPPRFLLDGAFGYHDEARIRADLAAGGWSSVSSFEAVDLDSRARSAEAAATAMCHGGPLRTEIERRDPSGLDAATASAAAVLGERYGFEDPVAPMRAFVITATRS